MKCPKCGKDMQPGFLQTAKIVAFNKTRHKVSLNPKDKEDIILARKAFRTDKPGSLPVLFLIAPVRVAWRGSAPAGRRGV